jgi:hypothetical protein
VIIISNFILLLRFKKPGKEQVKTVTSLFLLADLFAFLSILFWFDNDEHTGFTTRIEWFSSTYLHVPLWKSPASFFGPLEIIILILMLLIETAGIRKLLKFSNR